MCHPIGYGLERLDSKLGYMYRVSSDNNWGRFFFFFFEKMARGVGGRLFVGGYYFKYRKIPKTSPGAYIF